MDGLRLRINKVFKGAGKSFYRFPASIISAAVISIIALIRIRMEWNLQDQYSLLFNSIQISFVLGAVLSMATVALNEIRLAKGKSFFILANLVGILVAIISFLLLYFYGGQKSGNQVTYLSSIALARVSVAIFISALAFVYIMSKARSIRNFSDSFFISHRAFVVAGIYGLVIMLGVSGVLGAFQGLIYNGMSYRVYQYLGVAVGFLTYIIFLGYFPSFKEMDNEIEVEKIKEQPNFILILFDYIIIPIILALTVVLLIWSLRVLTKGVDVSFNTLSAIASSYVMIGIWLHIMVAQHEAKLAVFYKKAYPIAAILISAFEAWALFTQLSKFGLKTAEYSFLMIWIFGLVSVLLLIFLKDQAYRKIAITAAVIAFIWVLPIIGYQDITFSSQVKRLEKTLINQGLLVDDSIRAKEGEIEQKTRGEITDAVEFIAYSEKTNKPLWFKKDLNKQEIFKETFGFEKTYGVYQEDPEYHASHFRLETDMIDIREYSLALNMHSKQDNDVFKAFKLGQANYEIMVSNQYTGVPKLTLKREDRVVIEEDMTRFLDNLSDQYPLGDSREVMLGFKEMSMVLEGEGVAVLLVFNNIDAYFDQMQDKRNYYVDLHGIYIRDN